jgi:hypothetical protein
MPMTFLFRSVLFLLILLTLPARANLGETVAQCVTRYGKPNNYSEAGAKNPFGTLVFTAGPYGLIVFLINNVEVGARVSKKDNTAFSDTEMQNIMGADSAHGAWISATPTDPGTLQWTRADKATAIYDKDKHMLIFTSPAMAAALDGK